MRITVLASLAAVLALAPAARAEEGGAEAEEERPRLRAGALVGLNFSSFNGSGVDDSATRTHTAKTAPAAGAFLTYPLNERWAVEGEVLFTTKGASFADDVTEGTDNFHYLEFPLLGKLILPVDLPVVPHGYGGFALSYLLAAEREETAGGETDLKADTKELDVGFIVGAGAALPTDDGAQLFVDLRYEVGLRNFDDDADGDGRDRNAHNSVFTVLAGYAF